MRSATARDGEHLWFIILNSSFNLAAAVLLDRDNVHSRKRHTAIIIKPNYDPAPARVNARMTRAGNCIAVTATGHNGKRLKWGCGKVLAYIGGHKISLVNSTPPSKRI
jgi:hypothetical protein